MWLFFADYSLWVITICVLAHTHTHKIPPADWRWRPPGHNQSGPRVKIIVSLVWWKRLIEGLARQEGGLSWTWQSVMQPHLPSLNTFKMHSSVGRVYLWNLPDSWPWWMWLLCHASLNTENFCGGIVNPHFKVFQSQGSRVITPHPLRWCVTKEIVCQSLWSGRQWVQYPRFKELNLWEMLNGYQAVWYLMLHHLTYYIRPFNSRSNTNFSLCYLLPQYTAELG